MDLIKNVLCPYCLQKLTFKDLEAVCPMCNDTAAMSKMDILLNKSPKCRKAECRGQLAIGRRCRLCGAELPTEILDYIKHLRFSLLGVSGAGKTVFLTTMLQEFRNAQDAPLGLSAINTETRLMFDENCNMLYENRKPVEPTPPGMPPTPHQWRLSDKLKKTQKKIPSYSLTIFDGAGEDCTNVDPVISRYINGSKTLIILVDPLALPGINGKVERDVILSSTTAEHSANETSAMVDELANYIRRNCNMAPNKLIDKDVAVVFTKIDAVRSTFGSATVMQPSPHMAEKGFVKADSEAVDAEIRDWLRSYGENAFLNSVETNFQSDKVCFFGVSSLGQPPTGNGQLGKIMPHRVLDPLMWMLSKEGIIPSV